MATETLAGPAPTSVDETDRFLLTQLLEHGRSTNRELALAAGISESAVSIRLKKLMNAGSLVFTALIDWEVAGFEWFAIVRIRTAGTTPGVVARRIAELDECEAVTVAVGAFDVLAYFLLKDRDEVHHVITERLGQVPGIDDMVVDLVTESSVTGVGRQVFIARNVPPIRLPAPRVEVDDLDIALMQSLVTDGRQSSRAIARAHDVAEGTVRSRLGRLDKAGLCQVTAMVEPLSLGYAGVIAHVTITVQRNSYARVRESLNSLPGVVFIASISGASSLAISLTAFSQSEVLDLVATEITGLEGVHQAETLFMIDVVRFSPYLKRL
ncbi:HTH-type transcriptional regulator LrpC [Gordonia rubripertincta]|nr:HTH-type transcriptional regulator LrpC [Gordonia rubripertincta]